LPYRAQFAEKAMSMKAYGYAWVTLVLFMLSITGHWIFGWFAFVSDQQLHGATPVPGDYVIEALRDTLENWQSEFLQLLWQVGGLALFLYVGSPQSKEGDDRKEARLDAILRRIDPENAEQTIQSLDRRYMRK
jgi:hypothetical protein